MTPDDHADRLKARPVLPAEKILRYWNHDVLSLVAPITRFIRHFHSPNVFGVGRFLGDGDEGVRYRFVK